MIIENYKDSTKFIIEDTFMYPNQLVSTKDKEDKDFIKATMDYFSTVALSQYNMKRRTIPKNYDLYNGIFHFDDFIKEDYTQQMLSLLDEEPINDEPSERLLKHYPIINGPIDTMLGELGNRTAKQRVKAIDELSQSEIFGHRQELIVGYLQEQIMAQFAQQGLAESPEMQTSLEKIQQKAKTYATRAEQWGNKTLKALKNQFNLKAKSEEGMRDYLISGDEWHHLHPDNSRIGFGYTLENPRTTDDCWAAGTIDILTISQILDRFKLTEKEIKHLYKQLENPFYGDSSWSDSVRGINSIKFNAHPLGYFDSITQSSIAMQGDPAWADVNETDGFSPSYNVNQTFIVTTCYYKSKEKIGLFKYIDEEGIEQSTIINDTIDPMILKQGKVEWTWRNKWMYGYRIGNAIYNLEPLKHANSMPLIGTFRRLKNSVNRSLVDLMKPYQALFNILMNKIWHSLDIEKAGMGLVIDINLIPKKDSEDPVETFLWELKEKGVAFIDSSPENTGGQVSFNQISTHDMSETVIINRNLQVALAIRDMCWEMVGFNRQRLGETTSSETATAINTALTQSFAQSEPWFSEHEYVMDKVTQTMLDIAQYIELQKPESTLNYLNSDLDNVFLRITRDELLRDLFIITTSSQDDRNIVKTMQQLAQAAMQNGTELEDIFDILYTDSERKIKDVLEDIKIRKQKQIEDQQNLEREQMAQQKEMFDKQLEENERIRVAKETNENINLQLDRNLKIDLELIEQLGAESSYDPDVDSTARVVEQAKLAHEVSKDMFDRTLQQKQLSQKDKELSLKEEEIKSKERIAKTNKNKFDSKKKK
jgi:hypothetical protein